MAAKLSGGGGGDRYTVEQNADINVTPFVDIMLVLLIIFMVSIPLATVSIKLDMPPSDKNQIFDPKKAVFINITNGGQIFIKDKGTSMQTLPGDLDATFRQVHPETADVHQNTVPIRADSEVKYEQFMDVLNRLEESGYLKIALVTEDIK